MNGPEAFTHIPNCSDYLKIEVFYYCLFVINEVVLANRSDYLGICIN